MFATKMPKCAVILPPTLYEPDLVQKTLVWCIEQSVRSINVRCGTFQAQLCLTQSVTKGVSVDAQKAIHPVCITTFPRTHVAFQLL